MLQEESSQVKEEDEKPKDKLHHTAYELLTTERAYVARLQLLDQVCYSKIWSFCPFSRSSGSVVESSPCE